MRHKAILADSSKESRVVQFAQLMTQHEAAPSVHYGLSPARSPFRAAAWFPSRKEFCRDPTRTITDQRTHARTDPAGAAARSGDADQRGRGAHQARGDPARLR